MDFRDQSIFPSCALGLCTSTMVHSTGKVSEDNVFPMASEEAKHANVLMVTPFLAQWVAGGLVDYHTH